MALPNLAALNQNQVNGLSPTPSERQTALGTAAGRQELADAGNGLRGYEQVMMNQQVAEQCNFLSAAQQPQRGLGL